MTLYSYREVNGLVTKKWVFSRVGSRNQPFLVPEHGEPIVSEPFKRQAIGKPTQEYHYPKWGDDLDVWCDAGHMTKVAHQDVLDGKPLDCDVCNNRVVVAKNKKKETEQRRVQKSIARYIQTLDKKSQVRAQRLQLRWIAEANELERQRREQRARKKSL